MTTLISFVQANITELIHISDVGDAHLILESLIDNGKFGFKETSRYPFFNPSQLENIPTSAAEFIDSMKSQIPQDKVDHELTLILVSHYLENIPVYESVFSNSSIFAITCNTVEENLISQINVYVKHRFKYSDIQRIWWLTDRALLEIRQLVECYFSKESSNKIVQHIIDNKINKSCMNSLIWMKFKDKPLAAIHNSTSNAVSIPYSYILSNNIAGVANAIEKLINNKLTKTQYKIISDNMNNYYMHANHVMNANVYEYIDSLEVDFKSLSKIA
jgi:hypothetical protein